MQVFAFKGKMTKMKKKMPLYVKKITKLFLPIEIFV